MKTIIILIILLGVNAFFASAEIAFISLNQYTLKKKIREKNAKAKKIQKMLQNPSRFLALIQVGVTLAGFITSASASQSFVDNLAPVICKALPFISISVASSVAMLIITICIAFLSLIFGELVPKRIAMKNAEKMAYASVNILYIIDKIFAPVIWLLTKTTDAITKLCRIPAQNTEAVAEETIRSMVEESKKTGDIEIGEGNMIEKVFQLNDKTAGQIMTDAQDVVIIDINSDLKTMISLVSEYKYTRIPVYEGRWNNIVGIVHIKDILLKVAKVKGEFSLKDIVRYIEKVPKNTKIDDVLTDLRKSQGHMAVVEDARGKMIGIITVEDILEEIVGEIYDEHDVRKKQNKLT